MGGTATFDFTGTGAGLPATFTREHRGRQPHGQRAVRLHRRPVRDQGRPGDARARLDAHQHRVHGERRGDHHRHRHRRHLRPGRHRRLRPGRHHRPGRDRRRGHPDLHVHEHPNASLTISKTTEGGDGNFDFTGTGTGVPAAFASATAADTGAYAGNPITFGPTQFGTKTVTETVPAGWTLTDIVCAGDTTGVLIGADADFDAGDQRLGAHRCGRQRRLHVHEHRGRSSWSSRRSSSTTTAARRPSTTSASPPAPARSPSAPRSRPRPTPSPTPRRRSRSRPAPTPWPSSRLDGYEPSDWTCTNGDGGTFDAGSVTLAAGDPTVTCSITNDDQPVSLVIEKVVVNDDGGTAVVDDFGITTSAGALAFGAPVEAPADTFTYTAATLEVAPGTYTLAELELAGYEPTDWTCTNGDGGTFDAGAVTLAAGDPPVTCSITNDDQPVEPGHREGRRQRRRRHGDRRRLRDHHQRRRARLRRPGRGPGRHLHLHRRDARGRARHLHPRRARARRLRADRLDLHQRRRRHVRRGLGHPRRRRPTVTCSITNDDQPVSLVIEKVVVNDDGGTATVDDFGITTSAGALAFGAPVEAPADTFTYTAATLEVAPGTYTLAELELDGLRADRLDLHQRRRRHVRRGRGHPRRGRPDRHLLDHQRRPAGQPRHREGRRQRRRRHRDRRRLRHHHQRRRARLRRPGRGPGRHLHLHRRDARGRARHLHPRRARGDRLRADRLDLHQRRRRHVRRGLGHPRRRRPTGDLLDHQRRPAGQPGHREGRRQRRRRHARPSTTSASPPAPARSPSAPPVEAPADTFTYTAATLEVAPGTYDLAELEVAGYEPTDWTCTNGDGGTFDAGCVTLAAATRPSPARSPTTTRPVLSCRVKAPCRRPTARAGHRRHHCPAIHASRGRRCCSRLLIAIVAAGVTIARRWRSVDAA